LRVSSDYNLGKLHPKLARQWHNTKNNDLTPIDVTPGSSRKVWWRCDEGHEWQATVYQRTSGQGCPYCSGRKVGNDNNLAVKNPVLAKEWHPTKNENINPYDVTPGSHKKVWWICSQGHEWQTAIYTRNSGSGCPYCAGKHPTKENNLAFRNPDLVKEWHPTKNGELTPHDVTPGSGLKAWWQCDKGHEWQAEIKSRAKRGHGCPYCSNQMVGEDNNLAFKYPDLVKEWHPTKNRELMPNQVTPGSGIKVWWICERGHEWKTKIRSRALRGSSCPYCKPKTSRLELRIYCELKTIFDEVRWRKKINDVECDVYLPKYKLGLELDSYYYHVEREKWDREKGNTLFKQGVKVFHIRDEKLRRISPTDTFYRMGERHLSVIRRLLKNLLSHTSFKHEDELKISEYLKLNQFQNIREYQEILSLLPSPLREESLDHLYPQLANEWNYEKNLPLKPTMFTPGSGMKVWWICDQGHEWQAEINSRANKSSNCPKCRYDNWGKTIRKTIIERRGSLADKYPQLIRQWHPNKNGNLTPYDITPGSDQKVWWLCECGFEWQTRINSRTMKGSGCPKCYSEKKGNIYRKAVLQRRGSLAEHYPELVKEWHPTKNRDLTPHKVTRGSNLKVWWQCDQGHEWKATISNRTGRRSKCPICSTDTRREAFRKTVLKRSGSLADAYPDLVKEWHPTKNKGFTPYDVTPGSSKKVWWICSKRHEWKVRVADRTSKGGTGCPQCHDENRGEITRKAALKRSERLVDKYLDLEM